MPLLFAPGDGNQSDREALAPLLARYRQALDLGAVVVLDGAGYSRENLRALEEASGKLPYHRLVYLGVQEERRRGRVGRPRKGEAPLSVDYRLLARLEVDEGKLGRARRGLGRFLLATDVLEVRKSVVSLKGDP